MAVVLFDDFTGAAGAEVVQRSGWTSHPTSRVTTTTRFYTNGSGLAYCDYGGSNSFGGTIGADAGSFDHYVICQPDFSNGVQWVNMALRVTQTTSPYTLLRFSVRDQMYVAQAWANGTTLFTETVYYTGQYGYDHSYTYIAGDKFKASVQGGSMSLHAMQNDGNEVHLGTFDVSAAPNSTFAGWTSLFHKDSYMNSIEIGNFDGGGGNPNPTQTPNHGLLALF